MAVRYGGREFRDLPFCTFTNNMLIRDNIEFTSDEPLLHGLLDYASTTQTSLSFTASWTTPPPPPGSTRSLPHP